MNWLYFDSYNTKMRSESIWCSDTMTHEKISLIWTHIFRLPLFYCSSCWLHSHHHHQWEWIDRSFLYTSLSYISRIWHHKWKTRNGFIFQVTDYHLMICIFIISKNSRITRRCPRSEVFWFQMTFNDWMITKINILLSLRN